MARPKYIENDILLGLIKKYFDYECKGNIKKLKAADITRYINQNGYPNYPATTLRRTQIAMDYIEELKNTVKDEHYITTVSYQTIDAISLVNSNRSRDSLIKALTDRDTYYKMIADAATQSFDRYNELAKKYDKECGLRKDLQDKTTLLQEELNEKSSTIKELQEQLKAYKSIIDTYVYPEIANELLIKEGAIRKTEEIISTDALDTDIIASTTNIKTKIKSRSNVIEGLFRIDD